MQQRSAVNPSAVTGDSPCSSARPRKRRSEKGSENIAMIKAGVWVADIPKLWAIRIQWELLCPCTEVLKQQWSLRCGLSEGLGLSSQRSLPEWTLRSACRRSRLIWFLQPPAQDHNGRIHRTLQVGHCRNVPNCSPSVLPSARKIWASASLHGPEAEA